MLPGQILLPGRKADGGLEGFSCIVTAANQLDTWLGFWTAFPFGSISNEPVPGFTLNRFFIRIDGPVGGSLFWNEEAVLDEILGLTVWYDGVEYPNENARGDFGGVYGIGWTAANQPAIQAGPKLLEIK